MRRGREGDCWTGIDEDEDDHNWGDEDGDDWDDEDADADDDADEDEDDDNWADDADEIVALPTSCIVVKCTLDTDAHSLTKLSNYFCKQIVTINAGGGTQIQQIER